MIRQFIVPLPPALVAAADLAQFPNGRLCWGLDEAGAFFRCLRQTFVTAKPAAAIDFHDGDFSNACIRPYEGCSDFADRPSIASKTDRQGVRVLVEARDAGPHAR